MKVNCCYNCRYCYKPCYVEQVFFCIKEEMKMKNLVKLTTLPPVVRTNPDDICEEWEER